MTIPFLRWVGSKRWLSDQLSQEIVDTISPDAAYHEIFLGGGSTLLQVASRSQTIALAGSDINYGLINTWRQIQFDPEGVFEGIREAAQTYSNDDAGYRAARAWYNKTPIDTELVKRAAVFIYLNALGFNGIFRENAKGEFNVPFGKRSHDRLPSLEDIKNCAVTDHEAFQCLKFQEAILQAEPGDAIYADPPYYGTFVGYDRDGFSKETQLELAGMLKEASERGVKIWATNSDHPDIHEMYNWATITPILEPRRVAANGDRAKAACVLIRGGL